MEIDLPVQQILGIVLLVAGIGYGGASQLPKLWRRFKPTATKTGDSGHNSDAAAPAGFREHLAVVINAAPNAPADIILCYCEDVKTEAQVVVAERDRLQKLITEQDQSRVEASE